MTHKNIGGKVKYWRNRVFRRQYSSIIGGEKHGFSNILLFYWRKCYLFTPDKPDISDILAPIFTGFNMVKSNPGNTS
jgi:hypothetical protein